MNRILNGDTVAGVHMLRERCVIRAEVDALFTACTVAHIYLVRQVEALPDSRTLEHKFAVLDCEVLVRHQRSL